MYELLVDPYEKKKESPRKKGIAPVRLLQPHRGIQLRPPSVPSPPPYFLTATKGRGRVKPGWRWRQQGFLVLLRGETRAGQCHRLGHGTGRASWGVSSPARGGWHGDGPQGLEADPVGAKP